MLAAFFAAALTFAAPVSAEPAAYQAALARARRYEDDFGMWRAESFTNAVMPTLVGAAGCLEGLPKGKEITAVVSFGADGAVNGVFLSEDSAQARCIADKVGALRIDQPPAPDFAEELIFEAAGG